MEPFYKGCLIEKNQDRMTRSWITGSKRKRGNLPFTSDVVEKTEADKEFSAGPKHEEINENIKKCCKQNNECQTLFAFDASVSACASSLDITDLLNACTIQICEGNDYYRKKLITQKLYFNASTMSENQLFQLFFLWKTDFNFG